MLEISKLLNWNLIPQDVGHNKNNVKRGFEKAIQAF